MRKATPVLMVAGLLGASTPALAAPITSCYEVSLHTRYDALAGPPETIDPITFLLYLTFDDQQTGGSGSPDGTGWQTQYFGTPTFAGLPLLAPPTPDGSWVSSSETFTELSAYRGAPGEVNPNDHQQALAYQDLHYGTPTSSQYWNTRIGISGATSGPWAGSLDVFTFLNLLGTSDDSVYEFFYSSRANEGPLAHSLSYWGTVRAWDQSGEGDPVPAPEPATLTLLGGGLAAAFLRSRRRRRAD